MNRKTNNEGEELPKVTNGFSARFNVLLDKAGYSSIQKGRIKEFAKDMDMSVSGARKWIVQDIPPKANKLIEVCQKVIQLRKLGRYNPRRVACWLDYGEDVVPNPFDSGDSIANDHRIMGNLYVMVHKEARKLGIDIYGMESDLMDNVYKELMEDLVEKGVDKPEPKLVSSVLVLAANKKKLKAKKKKTK